MARVDPAALEPALVGESRHRLVDGLMELFDNLQNTGEPIWVSLEAPPGWGKTRVAREFYGRLAAERQDEPHYWPMSILDAAAGGAPADVNARRKRVFPERVRRPPGSLPNWMWWGIACSQRNSVESNALIDDLAQLEAHAPWLEAAWSLQVTLRERHNASLTQLRDALVEWAAGELPSKAVEVLMGGTVPGFGLVTSLARWTAGRMGAASASQRLVGTDATILADQRADDLADETARLLSRLAVPGLPVVVFVEDLHLSDGVLIDLLKRLKWQSATMLITTSWPVPRDDPSSPVHRLAALASPSRLVRVRHDAPTPDLLPRGAGLGELVATDSAAIVRFHLPRATENTVRGLAERFRNPLALELVCTQPAYRTEPPDGDLDLSPDEIAALPDDLDGLYKLIWTQLPEAVQQGLALAAITVPAAIDQVGGAADERWHPDRVAELADDLLPNQPGIARSIRTGATGYAWAQVVDEILRQFLEPGQLEVAKEKADRFYRRTRRPEIYAALATRILHQTGADASVSVAEHRARSILALHAIGTITDPAAVVDATLTLVKGMYAHPREHHQIVDLIERARVSLAGQSYEHDPAMLTLRQFKVDVDGQAGRLDMAIAEARSLVDDRTSVLGANHPDTLETRNALSLWLGSAGRVDEAIAAFRTLVDDMSGVLGANDRETLRTRSNMADSLASAGRFDEAIAEFDAVIGHLSIVDPDGTDMLTVRNSRASVLGELGRVDEAIAEFRMLLADRLQILGPKDQNTLAARNNLAGWLSEAGRVDEALAEFRMLLDDLLHSLGPEHRSTLVARQYLAYLFGKAGRVDTALVEFRGLLDDQVQILGASHPDTLKTRNALANLAGKEGRVDEAIAEFRMLLADQLQVLDPRHPDVLTTHYNLAVWLGEAGRVSEALAEFGGLLEDLSQTLGPGHPYTLKTRDGLDNLGFVEGGHVDELVVAFRKLLDDQLRILGPADLASLATREILVIYLEEAGRHDEAVAELRALLAGRERVLDVDHPDTIETRDRLAAYRFYHSSAGGGADDGDK